MKTTIIIPITLILFFFNSIQARTMMWEGYADNYNLCIAEIAFYENMDDSIYNIIMSKNFYKNRREFPAINFQLTPFGISEIKILGIYGDWLPMSFYQKLCSSLINQTHYPWFIGHSIAMHYKKCHRGEHESEICCELHESNDTISRKEKFIDHLRFQMRKDPKHNFESYTLILSYPNPQLNDWAYDNNAIPSREELIYRRKKFLESWLDKNDSLINKSCINDTEYNRVFGNELLKYKFEKAKIFLLLSLLHLNK